MTVTFINSLTEQLIKDLPGKKSHEIMKVSFDDLTIKNNQSLKSYHFPKVKQVQQEGRM